MSHKASVLETNSDASQILCANFLNDPKKVKVYALEVVNQVIDDAVKVASIVKETGQSWRSIMGTIYPQRSTNEIDELSVIEMVTDHNHKTVNQDDNISKMEGDLNIMDLNIELLDGNMMSPLEEQLKNCIWMIEASHIQDVSRGAGDVVKMWHADVNCTNDHTVEELPPKGKHHKNADKRKAPKVAKVLVDKDKDILDDNIKGKDLLKGNDSDDDETVIQFKELSDVDISKLSDKYDQMEIIIEKIEENVERTMQVIEPSSRDLSPIVKRPRLDNDNSFQSPQSETLEKYVYENTFLSLNCERDKYYDTCAEAEAEAEAEADPNISSDVFESIQSLHVVSLDESADGDKPTDPSLGEDTTQPQILVDKRKSSYSILARKKVETLKRIFTRDLGQRKGDCAECAEEKPSEAPAASRGGSVVSTCVVVVRRAWRALRRIFGGGSASSDRTSPSPVSPTKKH